MKNLIVASRNKLTGSLYKAVLKPIFFKYDPEDVHDKMTALGVRLGEYRFAKSLTRLAFGYSHKMLEQTILGIDFKNPIGLAAGFDKNAELTDILPAVGFGFEEVGSITGELCLGNPKPRLWRLPESEGLLVYYGLKNDGAEIIAKRLKNKKFENVIGISIAMTNKPENLDLDKAIEDYVKAFGAFTTIGDYFTLNTSCPNTAGGQPFVDANNLELLLRRIDSIATTKPVFIKLSPDMTNEAVDKILDTAKAHRVHGIIVTNLTKKRDNPNLKEHNLPNVGAVSGKPVQSLSDNLLAYIYKREKNRFVLVGCGGVFNAKDAYRKIRLGASLVQLITGMIYGGPQTIGEINRGIVKLLRRDGLKNISEAIGADVK